MMVKPALPYLDLIYAPARVRVPVAAYNVSGEYSMLQAAGLNGWLDEERATLEVLTWIKRAGADTPPLLPPAVPPRPPCSPPDPRLAHPAVRRRRAARG